MPTYVALSGPFFDGRSQVAMREGLWEVERQVAEEGASLIEVELPRVLQHPTGRYQSKIGVRRESRGRVVNDGGKIVYGPWLEGVGSRNYPRTRFKGYFTFRRMTQVLERRAGAIAEKTLRPFVGRFN